MADDAKIESKPEQKPVAKVAKGPDAIVAALAANKAADPPGVDFGSDTVVLTYDSHASYSARTSADCAAVANMLPVVAVSVDDKLQLRGAAAAEIVSVRVTFRLKR